MSEINLVASISNAQSAARTEGYAYRMGYDAGLNGANTTNCSFSIFSTKEQTKEWERGNRDGLADAKARP